MGKIVALFGLISSYDKGTDTNSSDRTMNEDKIVVCLFDFSILTLFRHNSGHFGHCMIKEHSFYTFWSRFVCLWLTKLKIKRMDI